MADKLLTDGERGVPGGTEIAVELETCVCVGKRGRDGEGRKRETRGEPEHASAAAAVVNLFVIFPSICRHSLPTLCAVHQRQHSIGACYRQLATHERKNALPLAEKQEEPPVAYGNAQRM